MKIHSVMSKLALLAGLAVVSTASAGTRHPGLQCVAVTGSGGILGNFGGTVLNSSSTSELNVVCPLDHVGTAATVSGQVTIFDRNPGVNLSCTLIAETATGASLTLLAGPPKVFTSPTTNAQVGNLSGTNGTYFYANCTIPRSSGGNVSHIAFFDIN